jgi:hypothetical protein
MTIVDYLLLGAFLVATIYTIYRLFVGWRYSSIANASADRTDDANRTNVPINQIGRAGTGAPWHSRKMQNGQEP